MRDTHRRWSSIELPPGPVSVASATHFLFADAEHDVARLLAALDVAGRLDDLVEFVAPVDHRPVLAGVDELLDEGQVFLAIAADAEFRTLASDEPCDENGERHVVHESEVGRDVDPAGLQRAPRAPERVLADRVENHVVGLAVLREVLPKAIEDVPRA